MPGIKVRDLTALQVNNIDIVIFGGGIAGLWTLNRLRQQGYQAVLLESMRLGEGQTRFAQGIIHGGTKYALTGKLTASAEAVSKMPSVWRDCLEGRGEIDLSNVKVLAEHQHLWSTANLTSRLSGFFASKLMKSRTIVLDENERPKVFQHKDFKGQVYQLDEPVLDTASLVKALSSTQQESIFTCDSQSLQLHDSTNGVEIVWQESKQTVSILAKKVILCAGAGNEELLNKIGLQQPKMQRRPLHMVMLRGMPDPLYAHCLGASTVPRITVTSHPDNDGSWVWYLGGQLAEEGVTRSEADQIKAAQDEIKQLLPWLDLCHAEWATIHIDRAEPLQQEGHRPDTAFVQQQGNVITAWPTKLALSPMLATEVCEMVKTSEINPANDDTISLTDFPVFASLPWQEKHQWS